MLASYVLLAIHALKDEQPHSKKGMSCPTGVDLYLNAACYEDWGVSCMIEGGSATV